MHYTKNPIFCFQFWEKKAIFGKSPIFSPCIETFCEQFENKFLQTSEWYFFQNLDCFYLIFSSLNISPCDPDSPEYENKFARFSSSLSYSKLPVFFS